jgi:hypothetical protein
MDGLGYRLSVVFCCVFEDQRAGIPDQRSATKPPLTLRLALLVHAEK